ncbi:MAG: ABC transporter substrate-binding protein [Clostridium sp.]|uniref:ABC transporter substrate-binding protein n=1 Tax=Clostridium sp. TaxID=1506 RepID=UPI003F3D8F1F
MRNKKFIRVILLILCMIFLVGCGASTKEEETIDSKAEAEDGVITLNLWSYFGGLEEVIKEFEKENPNIKINLKVFTYGEYEMPYKKSLLKEEGDADLFIIDSNHYGEFNGIEGLENLLKEDYGLEKYKKDFDKELWELGESIDGSEMLGLSVASAPIVTYYRADIMEKYGFPSEPKELAKFMENKENWFKIGETLRNDNIYIMQWVAEMIRVSTSEMPYFNEKLEYVRDNEKFKEAIEIAAASHTKGLSPLTDIWSEKGQKLLKDNQIAMLYLGSWGANELQTMVPEQKGKWRVTSLPFGNYGWNNATLVSMAKNSKNKAAAWKFIEFYIFKYNDLGRLGSVSAYEPFRNNSDTMKHKNEFLGGQKEQKLYEESMMKTEEYKVTALDYKAFKLWDNIFNLGVSEGKSVDEIMKAINDAMEREFIKEKEILLKEQK